MIVSFEISHPSVESSWDHRGTREVSNTFDGNKVLLILLFQNPGRVLTLIPSREWQRLAPVSAMNFIESTAENMSVL